MRAAATLTAVTGFGSFEKRIREARWVRNPRTGAFDYAIAPLAKTEVIALIAEDSVEERIYHEMLMPKDVRMTNLLDLFSADTREKVAA